MSLLLARSSIVEELDVEEGKSLQKFLQVASAMKLDDLRASSRGLEDFSKGETLDLQTLHLPDIMVSSLSESLRVPSPALPGSLSLSLSGNAGYLLKTMQLVVDNELQIKTFDSLHLLDLPTLYSELLEADFHRRPFLIDEIVERETAEVEKIKKPKELLKIKARFSRDFYIRARMIPIVNNRLFVATMEFLGTCIFKSRLDDLYSLISKEGDDFDKLLLPAIQLRSQELQVTELLSILSTSNTKEDVNDVLDDIEGVTGGRETTIVKALESAAQHRLDYLVAKSSYDQLSSNNESEINTLNLEVYNLKQELDRLQLAPPPPKFEEIKEEAKPSAAPPAAPMPPPPPPPKVVKVPLPLALSSKELGKSKSGFEDFKTKPRDKIYGRADSKTSLEKYGAFETVEVPAESDIWFSGFGSLKDDLEDGLDYSSTSLRYLVIKDLQNKPTARAIFHFSRSDPSFIDIVYFSAPSESSLIAATREASFLSYFYFAKANRVEDAKEFKLSIVFPEPVGGLKLSAGLESLLTSFSFVVDPESPEKFSRTISLLEQRDAPAETLQRGLQYNILERF